MQSAGLRGFLRRLYRVTRPEASDRELVAALVARRDEAAFEALVQRHGPMVLAVCRRMLRHAHDAEDAFQSTFLVLVRKAAAIRRPDTVASWLYGVACLTARKLRRANARRRALEARAVVGASENRTDAGALDDELCALPEKYRVPLVLCELEGRSRKEVAGRLRIPEGTLSSRLAKGRKLLARRLRRNGWALSAVTPAPTMLSVPLASATVEAGRFVLAGRGVAGVVSAEVITLSKGVLRAMFFRRLKTLAARQRAEDALSAARARFIRASQLEPLQGVGDQSRIVPQLVRQLESTRRAALPGATAGRDALLQKIGGLFKYRIAVETGRTETKDGGRIQILDVWGTKPEIAVGGSYLVRGKYAMPSHERGMLYFHLSASDPRMAVSYDTDLQCVSVQKGEGEFTLLHSMAGPGYFHLQLRGQEEGKSPTLADVYFGTGDTVWRNK
jgi:RNA polymerase sigma factor (sigma-70 family)